MAPREERHRKRLSPGEPRALFATPLFFGAARGSRKTLTPGTPRFPCVFHDFTSQSHENHDFYRDCSIILGVFCPRTGLMQGLRGLCAIGAC